MSIIDSVTFKIMEDITLMFDKVVVAQKQSMEALIESDNKKAVSIFENDSIINGLEEKINYDVIVAIAKYQPVATDLRKLIACIKVASDLERIADYAKTIAKTALVNNNKTFLTQTFLKNSLEMSNIIVQLLNETKVAFLEVDLDKAYNIMSEEKLLGKLMKDIFKSNPFNLIKEDNVDSFIHLMGILRSLERARGHIANINEDTIFVANGTFVEL